MTSGEAMASQMSPPSGDSGSLRGHVSFCIRFTSNSVSVKSMATLALFLTRSGFNPLILAFVFQVRTGRMTTPTSRSFIESHNAAVVNGAHRIRFFFTTPVTRILSQGAKDSSSSTRLSSITTFLVLSILGSTTASILVIAVVCSRLLKIAAKRLSRCSVLSEHCSIN